MRRSQFSLGLAVGFDLIDDQEADDFLARDADHWLGPLDRPFGRQSYGLMLHGELLGVAVSASTPNERCAHFSRYEVVELARCSAHRDHRDLTRVLLRLWRKLAADQWARAYGDHWPVIHALVSYQDETRHSGDLYRFDGWRRIARTKGSTGGGTWSRKRKDGKPKSVWAFGLDEDTRSGLESCHALAAGALPIIPLPAEAA